MPGNIRVIHVITRLDMGGSAQEALLTVSTLDPQFHKIILIKGSTSESAMTSAELKKVNQQLAAACDRGVEIINLPSLVRRISPWHDFKAFILLWGLIRKYKPHIVHTHTSKAGVRHLTRSLAAEWAPRGVRVNSISPGYTRTELLDQFIQEPIGREKLPHWLERTPMGRLGEVTDLQGAVVYLASEASDFVTGHDLIIDGGYCTW